MLQRSLVLSGPKVAVSATLSNNADVEQREITLSSGLIENPFRILTGISLSDANMVLSDNVAEMSK